MDLSILNRRSFLKATAVTGLATALEASAAEGLVKQAEPAKTAKKRSTAKLRSSRHVAALVFTIAACLPTCVMAAW